MILSKMVVVIMQKHHLVMRSINGGWVPGEHDDKPFGLRHTLNTIFGQSHLTNIM